MYGFVRTTQQSVRALSALALHLYNPSEEIEQQLNSHNKSEHSEEDGIGAELSLAFQRNLSYLLSAICPSL